MLNLDDAFNHFPTIKTNRLTLRQIKMEDMDAHFAIFSNPEVMAGHGMSPYTDRSQSEEMLSWYGRAFLQRKAMRWAIIHQETGQFIGSCGYFHITPEHFRAEIGYELDPAFWRQGLGTETVVAILEFAFATVNFHRIEAIVDPNNAASAALLRKIGFTEEGLLRDRFYDEEKEAFVNDWIFSILKPEFMSKYGATEM